MTPSAALRALGLAAGADASAIRKAYAARFKAMDVDADPEGYARLRTARDIALRMARTAATAPALPEDLPEPETAGQPDVPPPGEWPYAAPLFAASVDTDTPVLVAGHVPHAPVDRPPPVVIDAPAVPPATGLAFAGPPLMDGAPRFADVTLLTRPDRDLARLLHDPDAQGGPLDDDEEARARRCLDAMLGDAAVADLTRHGLIEDWLADLIAETWPRSAPLLPAAADAFGWENERGHLRERRSIAWLNARLRGLRFQEKVAEADHPLHAAWVELTRPGRSNMVTRLRVRRPQVKQLLDGIRQHFPELEQHLDPERVASWEGGGSGMPVTGFQTSPFPYLLVAVFALRFLGLWALGHDDSPPQPTPFGAPAVTAPADPDYNRIRIAAVIAAFGDDRTIDWLREQQASLSSSFESRLRAARAQGADEAATIAAGVAFVRRLALIDARDAGGDVLLEATRLRIAQIDAASKQGPDACKQFLTSLDLKDATLPDAVRDRERALASRMVEAGLLTEPRTPGVTSTSIPGKLIGRVIDATGLPEDRVRLALRNGGTNAEQCAVTRALLRVTLDWPGKERTTILKVV